MIHKKELVIALVAFLFVACAEKDGDMDDLVDLVPSACETYCDEHFECEAEDYEFDGDYGDEYAAALLEQCKLNCGMALEEGAYVLIFHNNEDSDEEYAEYIDSSRLTDFFECIMDTDLYTCEEFDGYGHYRLIAENEGDCNAIAQCWDILDSTHLSSPNWETWEGSGEGYCSQEHGDEDTSIYLTFGLGKPSNYS